MCSPASRLLTSRNWRIKTIAPTHTQMSAQNVSDRTLYLKRFIRGRTRRRVHVVHVRAESDGAWSSYERLAQYHSCSCDRFAPGPQVPLARELVARGVYGFAPR